MSTHLHLFRFTGTDDNVVLKFFANFSRFEYALKRAGFVTSGEYHSAKPNWREFAEKVSVGLGDIKEGEFNSAKSYLLQHPPRRQVFRDNSIRWEANCKSNTESEGQYLLRLVRDVRNNLFHGGKYDRESVDDGSLRNSELLNASLIILDQCLQLNRTLAFYFANSE